jgi:tetratricopeptide (TPR) repeat protein
MQSDFGAADQAMERAEQSLAGGTGDPVERARLLDLKASLRKDQRRFAEAARLLDRAIALYRDSAETQRAGRALLNQASLLRTAGHPKRALRALQEAVATLDPQREPRLLLCARHNLAEYLSALGRDLQAHRVFTEAQPLYDRFPDPWTQRRRLWLEGKILRGLRQLDAAEARLAAARRGFLDQDIAYDAALASLDLAAVYALQGRSAEQRRLVEELRPMIESHHLHREAHEALAYFRRAVEDQRATPRLVDAVLHFLDLARHDPGLRFEAPLEL